MAYALIPITKTKMARYPMRSLENMVSFILEAFTYTKSLVTFAKRCLPVQEDFSLLKVEELFAIISPHLIPIIPSISRNTRKCL